LALRALALVEVRAVCTVPVPTQIGVFRASGADQYPDILHVVRAGTVGARDQHLIVDVDVTELAL